jgi:hypothetical protein
LANCFLRKNACVPNNNICIKIDSFKAHLIAMLCEPISMRLPEHIYFLGVILYGIKGLLIPSPACGRGLGRGAMVQFETSRFRATSDPISFAQPKEIGERKGCPTPRPTATLRYLSTKASAELAQ